MYQIGTVSMVYSPFFSDVTGPSRHLVPEEEGFVGDEVAQRELEVPLRALGWHL